MLIKKLEFSVWLSWSLGFTIVFHPCRGISLRVPIGLQVQFHCSIGQWKYRLMTMIHMHLIFWTAPNQLWTIHSDAWAREGLVMRNWLISLHTYYLEPQQGPQQEKYLSTAQGRAARLRARVKGSRSRTGIRYVLQTCITSFDCQCPDLVISLKLIHASSILSMFYAWISSFCFLKR
jgi:hypothetical protein